MVKEFIVRSKKWIWLVPLHFIYANYEIYKNLFRGQFWPGTALYALIHAVVVFLVILGVSRLKPSQTIVSKVARAVLFVVVFFFVPAFVGGTIIGATLIGKGINMTDTGGEASLTDSVFKATAQSFSVVLDTMCVEASETPSKEAVLEEFHSAITSKITSKAPEIEILDVNSKLVDGVLDCGATIRLKDAFNGETAVFRKEAGSYEMVRISPPSQTDSQGWKIFRSGEYGIEFSYPPDLFQKVTENENIEAVVEGSGNVSRRSILEADGRRGYMGLDILSRKFDAQKRQDSYGNRIDGEIVPVSIGSSSGYQYRTLYAGMDYLMTEGEMNGHHVQVAIGFCCDDNSFHDSKNPLINDKKLIARILSTFRLIKTE